MLRFSIALVVVMLTCACGQASTSNESGSAPAAESADSVSSEPASLVQALYASYDATARTHAPIEFTPEIRDMVARADQLPRYVDRGFLEYDPYNGFRSDAVGQPTFENLTIEDLGQTESGATRVRVRYVIWSIPTEIVYDLKQVNGTWMIDDMTHTREGEETPWNLRRELSIDGITPR